MHSKKRVSQCAHSGGLFTVGLGLVGQWLGVKEETRGKTRRHAVSLLKRVIFDNEGFWEGTCICSSTRHI